MAAARRAGAGPDDPLGRGARRLHQDGVLRRRHANPRPSLAVAAGGDDAFFRVGRVHGQGGRDQAQRPPLSPRRHRGDERAHAPLLRDLQPPRHPRRGAVHGGVRLHQFPAGLRQFPHALDDAVGLALCGDPALRRAGRALRRRADRQWLAPRLRRRRRRSRGQGTRAPMTSNGLIVCLMAALFLVFGYLGVPVAFALIAAAATIAALVPPSIMAVVYGAIGNVSIAGLFLGGVAPGLMIGIGLMIYCYFFGPAGLRRPRSSLGQLSRATQEALLPLMIPVILLGGILTGWFTPTEPGAVAHAS